MRRSILEVQRTVSLSIWSRDFWIAMRRSSILSQTSQVKMLRTFLRKLFCTKILLQSQCQSDLNISLRKIFVWLLYLHHTGFTFYYLSVSVTSRIIKSKWKLLTFIWIFTPEGKSPALLASIWCSLSRSICQWPWYRRIWISFCKERYSTNSRFKHQSHQLDTWTQQAFYFTTTFFLSQIVLLIRNGENFNSCLALIFRSMQKVDVSKFQGPSLPSFLVVA